MDSEIVAMYSAPPIMLGKGGKPYHYRSPWWNYVSLRQMDSNENRLYSALAFADEEYVAETGMTPWVKGMIEWFCDSLAVVF